MRAMRLCQVFLLALISVPLAAAPKWKALIVDGQNNHQWQQTTPLLKQYLEATGLFEVDVATSPPQGADLSGFKPEFGKYKVVVSNYNGEPWSAVTILALAAYVRGGGGFVSFHAADNAFPDSAEYNEMIGIGGWGGRTEKHGPYHVWRDGAMVSDPKPGPGGHHGTRHPFVVTARAPRHPVMKGLPPQWLHAQDELYDKMRGPGRNMTVLATAFADPAQRGSGEHEPVLMTIQFGKGRVFHTTLGHDVEAMQSAGFIATLQRGAEWAATGRVTQKPPANLRSPD